MTGNYILEIGGQRYEIADVNWMPEQEPLLAFIPVEVTVKLSNVKVSDYLEQLVSRVYRKRASKGYRRHVRRVKAAAP